MTDSGAPWVEQGLERQFSDALLDTVGALVCVIDREGRIVRFNRASERLCGYTIEEVRDRPFWDLLIPPDEVEGVRDVFCSLVEQQLPNGCDNHWITKTGERRLIRWSNTVLRDKGRSAWVIGTGIDITDCMRAERRAAFLADAGAVLSDAVLDVASLPRALARHAVPFLGDWCAVRVIGPGGVVRTAAFVHADPEVGARLEPFETFLSRTAGDRPRVVPDGRPVVINGREACFAALDAIAEPAQRARLHEVLDVAGLSSFMAVPLAARGRTLGVIVLGSARADRRYGAEDLVLAEAFAARAALSLDNAYLLRDAQRALAAREEFLVAASHELRTPLTSLQTAVQALLAHRCEAGEPPWGAPLLAILQRSTGRLAGLVEDILDISRLTSGSAVPALHEVDLAGLVNQAVEAASGDLARAGCAVSVAPGEPVMGRWDRRWVLRILHHLLANAVKYGPGRPIEIGLERVDERARLTVRDHGIGIPAEEQARIFERFERAVPVLRYGGLGLGLWLVRRMVEELGGGIGVRSRPGDGATFTVELPLAGPPTARTG